jgi:putative transposase
MAVLVGTDLFSVEVLRWRGWVTYYVLFFLPLETRRVTIAGIPGQPEEMWMEQMARNVTFAGEGCLNLSKGRDRLHDRDAKFCASFRETLAAGGVKCLRLAARSPNLNGYSEHWVRTVKQECLSKLILFGEGSLRRALRELEAHNHGERNPQGKGNVVLFPYAEAPTTKRGRSIRCHERLGGLLKYYYRKAA